MARATAFPSQKKAWLCTHSETYFSGCDNLLDLYSAALGGGSTFEDCLSLSTTCLLFDGTAFPETGSSFEPLNATACRPCCLSCGRIMPVLICRSSSKSAS